jgi:hypothetical protein
MGQRIGALIPNVGTAGCLLFAALVVPSGALAQAFDPMTDGFGFQNYTNDTMPDNLTPAEIQRMFGDRVCSSGTGASCRLTPQADQWREQMSAAMNGGHCEGMAVLALRLQRHDANAMTFGMGATNAFMLGIDNNELLQREIGYWWTLQTIPEVQRATLRGAPAAIVMALRMSFMGMGDVYTIGFFKRDGTGGHAVTPFAVQDVDATHANIMIYDNNFPGQARTIQVDTAANTWSYSAAASPDVPESLYDGDAMTQSLELVPLSARTGMLTCPFCGDYATGAPSTRGVAVTGDASILIQDAMGHHAGHLADGSEVNDIPGAEEVEMRSSDLWHDRSEPGYRVPGGTSFDVMLSDGGRTATPDHSMLAITGAGYYLGVENVSLAPGQMDVVHFYQDTARIGYQTMGMETPDVVLAAQTSGSDWVFDVRSRGDSAGQTIDASIAFDTNILSITFGGADANSEFDLLMAREDGASVIEFANDNVTVANGTTLLVHFGDFTADGTSVAVGVDTNHDGMADSTMMLADTGSAGIGPGDMPTTSMPHGHSGCSASPAAPDMAWPALGVMGVALGLVRRTRTVRRR